MLWYKAWRESRIRLAISALALAWLCLVVLLMEKGVRRERAHGTAGFTLAIPVSRSRLIAVRAAVGVAELALLALLPALIIPALSPFVGESYPFTQALHFSVLWAGCGTVVLGTAFFLSTLLAGEYSAWIVCFVVLFFYSAIVNVPPLASFPSVDFFRIMAGRQLIGPLPWLPLSIIMLLALGWVMVADRITQRQDF
jgi:ABC-type transport system involved in multi-copper enzyme maturation permease subunit